mmetsp:Transcript_17063/g.32279  ORF Transcript_17063/g.32279 Transcript_17063/m.32279 type:complete len:331 (+) Transcript_17063:77-1069(+)
MSSIDVEINKDNKSNAFESNRPFAVIATSGFAGALAGLSISRSRIRHAVHNALGSTTSIPGPNQFVNLPLVFAISTATFASIIEYSSIISPTKYLLNALNSQDILDIPIDIPNLPDRFQWDNKCTTTLGDYAIGGATAGAIFSGAIRGGTVTSTLEKALQTSVEPKVINTNMTFSSAIEKQKSVIGKGKVITLASKKYEQQLKRNSKIMSSTQISNSGRMDKSASTPATQSNSHTHKITPLQRPRVVSGLSTGLMLGLAAGMFQILLSKLETYFSSQEGKEADGSENEQQEVKEWTKEQEDELDAKIKGMTTEEIQKEIEILRKNLRKNN